MDGAILFSDILMLPYALGQKLAYREGEGPILEAIEVSGRRRHARSANAPERG
jgi:uroporphyrinogen decarboxylase